MTSDGCKQEPRLATLPVRTAWCSWRRRPGSHERVSIKTSVAHTTSGPKYPRPHTKRSGWVAPIAANREHVDFVIVCFGLAVSVIDEDQQEVEIEMREKGHSPTIH